MANHSTGPSYPSPSNSPTPPDDSGHRESTLGPMLESGDPGDRETRTTADPTQQSSMAEQGGKPELLTLAPELDVSSELPGDRIAADLRQSTRRLVEGEAPLAQQAAAGVESVLGKEVQNLEAGRSPVDRNISSDYTGSGAGSPTPIVARPLIPVQPDTAPFIARRIMKPGRVERHLDARRLRQSWMARVQDDFVLKPGRSIPRRGVLDRSSYRWDMIPDRGPEEYRGIDEGFIQTLKYVPDEDWLFEDVAGVRAPLDLASILQLGKILRPLLRSDDGPIPAAGERLFVIEDAGLEVPNSAQPPQPVEDPAVPPHAVHPEEWNDPMMRRVAAIQAETRRVRTEKANAALEAIGKAAALAKLNAARAQTALVGHAPPLTATLESSMAGYRRVPERMNYRALNGSPNAGWPRVASRSTIAQQNTIRTGPNPSSFVIPAPVGSLVNQGERASNKRQAADSNGPPRPAKSARTSTSPGYDYDPKRSEAGSSSGAVQNPVQGPRQPQDTPSKGGKGRAPGGS